MLRAAARATPNASCPYRIMNPPSVNAGRVGESQSTHAPRIGTYGGAQDSQIRPLGVDNPLRPPSRYLVWTCSRLEWRSTVSESKQQTYEPPDIDALKEAEKEKLHAGDYPDPAALKESTPGAPSPPKRRRRKGSVWPLLILLFILFYVTGGANFWSYGWLLFLIIPMVWGCGRRYC